MRNDFLLGPDNIEFKKEMLSKYQFMISDFYVSIGKVKKLILNVFDKEKYVLYYENLRLNL